MAWDELYLHKPDARLMERMDFMRGLYIALGEFILDELPESKSKDLAKTHLEDSLMRAIQALALQGEKQDL